MKLINSRIIYRILGERVEVLAIVHASRDLLTRQNPPWRVG
jgi:plasmid stabilization system protein ParE